MPEKKLRRKLKTVGDLRAILSEAIDDVMNGDMDVHTASAVVKLASQINASFVAEIEVARFVLAQTNTFAPLGSLALDVGGPEPRPMIEADPAPPLTPSPTANALAGAAAAMHAAKVARQTALAPRVIDHRPSGVMEMPGMPAPGRSALDQRRAL